MDYNGMIIIYQKSHIFIIHCITIHDRICLAIKWCWMIKNYLLLIKRDYLQMCHPPNWLHDVDQWKLKEYCCLQSKHLVSKSARRPSMGCSCSLKRPARPSVCTKEYLSLTNWKITIFNWYINYFYGPFSIAISVSHYQRVWYITYIYIQKCQYM